MHTHPSDARRLWIVLAVTAAYFLTELIGGIYTNSLALLSDAVHLLTDLAAILLSLFALWVAARPARAGKTYGYLRAEILGALLNGLFLWVVVAFLVFEAVRRFNNPAQVNGLPVMVIAAMGLLVNSFSAWFTHQGSEEHAHGMALRAVFLHVLSDLVGSLGVLIAGALIYFTHWHLADPLVSMFIAILIVYGSWGLIREGVDILMEAVPANINLDELRSSLLGVAGTEEVHDLHVWCLTARELALSAHAVVGDQVDSDRVLSDMSEVLAKFNIHHMTVQLERDSRRKHEPEHF
ncbi:MAG TPA: cation diffusion facilitator family transporter [Candidatus Binataceae bacterium]|nr:cation diffusion facilitator family transporter [Candidatus Binataceae bacterium]